MEWTRARFLQGDVAALMDEIHDQYFDIRMILYDQAGRVWSVPIGEAKWGPYDKKVVVQGVTGYHIEDTEKIRIYDINRLWLDDARGVLRLECNVPLGVWLHVAADFRVMLSR